MNASAQLQKNQQNVLESPATEDAVPQRSAPSLASPAGNVNQMVPHLTIDVHCVSKAFASVVAAAAKDRRMAKARIRVAMGGAKKATAHYRTNHTPNLLIIETAEQGMGIFGELSGVAEVCDEGTRVMVAGGSNDISLYREMLRQGVSEYIVTPVSQIQFIDTIAAIYADPSAHPAGRVVACLSANGGAGASTIAQNIAYLSASEFHRYTILLDLDVEFGSAGINYNIEGKQGLLDALAAADDLDETKLNRLLHPQSNHLRVLVSPGSPADSPHDDGEAAGAVAEASRSCADLVVLDLPHQWGKNQRAIQMADQVIIVAEPELISARNAQQLYRTLVATRPNDDPPILVVNRAKLPKRPEISTKDLEEILDAKILQTIEFDTEFFGNATSNGKMLKEQNAKHPSIDQLRAIALKVNGESVQKKFGDILRKGLSKSKGGFFDKITGMLSSSGKSG